VGSGFQFPSTIWKLEAKKEVVPESNNYDFNDMKIENISNLKGDLFNVQGAITVEKVSKREQVKFPYLISPSINIDQLDIFSFELNYDKRTKKISNIVFRTSRHSMYPYPYV
jgi:hypothetical protein